MVAPVGGFEIKDRSGDYEPVEAGRDVGKARVRLSVRLEKGLEEKQLISFLNSYCKR